MKRYERNLLNHLNGATTVGDEEPLQNVKREMGSLRAVEGNPMFKAEIAIQITTYFTNPFGVLIAPAALPAASQTASPVWLFGQSDSYGSYQSAQIALPMVPPWLIQGATGYLGFNIALVTVPAGIPVQNGDFLISFLDAAVGGNTFGIIIHCNNIAYTTLLNSFSSDLMVVNLIRMFVPPANINQYINPVVFGYRSLFGKLATDHVDPRMYQLPSEQQNQIADIPLKFAVDKNLFLGFDIDVFCQQIGLIFFVQKVEPLTIRPK